jgi:hypothetical protein
MDWDENHSESERLAGQAEVAAREGNRKRAAALYREAAEAESRALASVDPTKDADFGNNGGERGLALLQGRGGRSSGGHWAEVP